MEASLDALLYRRADGTTVAPAAAGPAEAAEAELRIVIRDKAEGAEGEGAVTVDPEGELKGEVRIDVDMADRDTVYLHLDAATLRGVANARSKEE